MRYINRFLLLTLVAVLAPTTASGQEEEIRFGQRVRIENATVLRGGPASPPRVFPQELTGTVVGMRNDTLLFETGNEPVYWIPLRQGDPTLRVVSQRPAVARTVIVGGGVGAVLGAITGWTLHNECREDPRLIELGLRSPCAELPGGGQETLEGALIGAGVGAVIGFGLGQFAMRSGWFPVDIDRLQFVAFPPDRSFAVRWSP